MRLVQALVIQDLSFYILGDLQPSISVLKDRKPQRNWPLEDVRSCNTTFAHSSTETAHFFPSLDEFDGYLSPSLCIQSQLNKSEGSTIQVSYL